VLRARAALIGSYRLALLTREPNATLLMDRRRGRKISYHGRLWRSILRAGDNNNSQTSRHSDAFNHFYRWRALPLMFRTFRQSWIPFSEWGYLILVATLAQATLLGILLVVSPLFLLHRRIPPLMRRFQGRVPAGQYAYASFFTFSHWV